MKTEKFTDVQFAKRIAQMLENADSCSHCPATKGFIGAFVDMGQLSGHDRLESCMLCRKLVGLGKAVGICWNDCPCNVLGPSEAAKRAWIKIEELGILD